MSENLLEMKYSQILAGNQQLRQSMSGTPFSIAVLGNIMTTQLNDILEFNLRRQHINAVLKSGDYDNILQDVSRFSDEKVLIVFWETANILDGLPYKIDEMSPETLKELTNKIKGELTFFFQSIENYPQVIFNTFSAKAFSHRSTHPTRLDELAFILNQHVWSSAPKNTTVIDLDKVLARVGIANAIDYRYFYSSKAMYSVDFYRDYSLTISPYITAPLGKSKKVIILDCDNTLWKGILGEDGPDGIDMSPESNEGAIFQEVQSLMLQLQKQGILLGLCSKNNAEDVDEILKNHPDIRIKEDNLSIKKVNWDDKATNLKAIAAELNIGIDSLVFIDDSDFEINLVKEQLPEVTCLQVPKRLALYPDLVRQNLAQFTSLSSSLEDQARSQMYLDEKKRQDEQSTFANMEEYIESLQLQMTIYKNSTPHLPRIAQLTQKTNQFNLTTKRYTEADITQFMNSEHSLVYAFQLKDRFGDYGLTGEAIVLLDKDNSSAMIDTFLMSCRVLGRKVEDVFFETVLKDLAEHGVERIIAEYRKTPKNAQVANLYDRLGLKRTKEEENTHSYELRTQEYSYQNITYIGVSHGPTN